MINETLGKENFQSLIKQVYQQTVSIMSLEREGDRISFLKSVKNFESNYVYNWQRFIYPVFNGPERSPYAKYSGFRSAPWAEYDILDPERGGVSGWTVTAEPWATEHGLPCLWDGTRGQPNSITGAIYCLSSKIDSILSEEFEIEEYDDSEIRSLIHCNDLNIRTLYKDIYACDLDPNCSGNEKLQFSFQRHLYEIFSQVIKGGPDLSGDFSCENAYPELFLNISTCDIAWDPNCPLVEIGAGSINGGATIKLENNGVAYDGVEIIGLGNTTVGYNNNTNQIEISSTGGSGGSTYTLTSSTVSSTIVSLDLTDSSNNITSIALREGNGITLTESSNNITVDAKLYSNKVDTAADGVELVLNMDSTKVDGTFIKGSGNITVSKLSDSTMVIEDNSSSIGMTSKSILGQKAISPIRAIDYYSDFLEPECCFEYNYNVQVPAVIDRALQINSGSPINSGTAANLSGKIQTLNEYVLEPSSLGGRGMSLSFWLNKQYADWIGGDAGKQVIFCIYDANNVVNFELILDYPKNHPLDPEYSNVTISQGQEMNEHLVMYVKSSTGFLYRLIDITEEGLELNWKHFSIVLDLEFTNSSTVELYLDGSLYSNALSGILDSGNTSGISSQEYYSLFAFPVSPCRDFRGALEDFVIYSDRLTSIEASSIFGERKYKDIFGANSWVNDKVAEWWELGEDAIFDSGGYQVGDAIASQLSIVSRVNGETIDGIARNGTEIEFSTEFAKFELAGHQYAAAYMALAGSPIKATGSIEITDLGFANPGWIVNLRRVVDDVPNLNIFHEILVYESTNDPALDGTQNPNTFNYYFYTGLSKEEMAVNLGDAISASGFTADFNPVVTQATVNLEARDYGERFNTPITSNGSSLNYVTLNGFSGGLASTIECLPVRGPGTAEGRVMFMADFGNTNLASGSKVTLESTDGTSITYRCESSSAAVHNNGDLDGSEVVFLNGDDLTGSSPTTQTVLRFEKALDNFIDAINGANGHNQNGPSDKFVILKAIQKSTYSVYLTQSQHGVDGNTSIPTVDASPNPSGTVLSVNFSGGSDSLGGVPDNLETYAQEAFLNRWSCTSQTLSLAPGKRYEIQLSGYNMFKNQNGSKCFDENMDIEENLDNILEGIFGSVASSEIFKQTLSLNGETYRSMSGLSSQDLSGISVVLRPADSCVEDPRNIYFTPEYSSIPDYIEKDYHPNAADDYYKSLGSVNKTLKSSVLAKNAFRNFFSKWKAKLILTVGKSSIGDEDKVNIYFKGEGVEFDLYEYSSKAGELLTSSFDSLSELEAGYQINLLGSGGLSKDRFDFEFTNPFRHRRYLSFTSETYTYALEDFNNKLKSNVVENVPIVSKSSTGMNSGTHYYVRGTINTITLPSHLNSSQIPLQVGDEGWFIDVVSEEGVLMVNGTAEVAITLTEWPGKVFYMTALSTTIHPVSDSNVQNILSYYNAAFVNSRIGYRLFPLESCEIKAYDTLEVITWGVDSGRWGVNLIGALSSSPTGAKDYYPPDGEIDIDIYLEEFTLRESFTEELCEFERINPFASFDFGLSGGLPNSSVCNYCPDWEVAVPFELQFLDSNGTELQLDSFGKYSSVSTVNGYSSVIVREAEDCTFDYCLEEIIDGSQLSYTSNSGNGYLIQDVNSVEASYNSTMTVTSANITWEPSDDHSTEMIVWLKEDESVTEVIDINTNTINLVSWTSQSNSLVFESSSGNVDSSGSENRPELVYSSNGNRFLSFDHTNHESISSDYNSVFSTFDSSSGDGVGSVFMLVKLEQDNVADAIGDELNTSTTDHTVARLFSIGRGLQLRLHREKLVNNTYSTYLRFDNNSNSRDAGLTGAVGVNQIFLIEVVFGNGADASRRGIYVNGTKYSTQDIPQSTNFDWANSPDMRIGRFPDWNSTNPSQTFDHSFSSFELGEFLLFDEELTETQRQKIEGYLMHKFSIENSLPAGHPYLGNAPTT